MSSDLDKAQNHWTWRRRGAVFADLRLPGGDLDADRFLAARSTSGPSSADLGHLERLRRILAGLPPAERVYAPLAAGGHVDHRLTRRAAEAVFGRRLEYYEDYPYVRSRVVLVKALGFSLWRPRTVELETADLDAKVRAFGCFASQLSTAFADPEDMKRQVRVFFERRGRHKAGGERLWRRLL